MLMSNFFIEKNNCSSPRWGMKHIAAPRFAVLRGVEHVFAVCPKRSNVDHGMNRQTGDTQLVPNSERWECCILGVHQRSFAQLFVQQFSVMRSEKVGSKVGSNWRVFFSPKWLVSCAR